MNGGSKGELLYRTICEECGKDTLTDDEIKKVVHIVQGYVIQEQQRGRVRPFRYKGTQVRVKQDDGEPWWVLADVCKALGLSNPSVIAERLDPDERAKSDLGRQGKGWIINESGLYSVILRSDKPEAKQFKRWVTHEVLPSIRRTGGYSVDRAVERAKLQAEMEQERIALKAECYDMIRAILIRDGQLPPFLPPTTI